MGQSLAKQYTHIIFSTKYQEPLIIEPVEQELHQYKGGICKRLECNPIQIGGKKSCAYPLHLVEEHRFDDIIRGSESKLIKMEQDSG